MIGRANGVGPKLALRVVTELKGKVPAIGAIDAGTLGLQTALGEGVASGNVADAVSALTNLGYSSAQASAAVARVVAREGDDTATEKLNTRPSGDTPRRGGGGLSAQELLRREGRL